MSGNDWSCDKCHKKTTPPEYWLWRIGEKDKALCKECAKKLQAFLIESRKTWFWKGVEISEEDKK